MLSLFSLLHTPTVRHPSPYRIYFPTFYTASIPPLPEGREVTAWEFSERQMFFSHFNKNNNSSAPYYTTHLVISLNIRPSRVNSTSTL